MAQRTGRVSTPGDTEIGQTTPPTDDATEQENVPVEFEEEPELRGDYIQYTGQATVREITRSQWESAGVGRQAGVEWNVSNRHLVSVDDLTDAARERVLKEPGFKLVSAADVS